MLPFMYVSCIPSVLGLTVDGGGRERERELAVGFDLRFNLANWPVV